MIAWKSLRFFFPSSNSSKQMLHINSSETLSTLSLVAILFSKVGSLLEAVSFE